MQRSAGIVVMRFEAGEPRVLLLRAYRNWGFPKGHIEPGETPLEAAKRETREETGIGDVQFAWGEVYYETEPYARGKIARYYIAKTDREDVVLGIEPELGRPEHHEYRWCGFSEGQKLLVPRLQRVLAWVRQTINQ